MKARRWLAPALALCAAGLGCQTARLLSGTPFNALNTPEAPALTASPTDAGPQAYQVPDEGRYHINAGETAQYKHYPPSSGLHYGRILDWGIYDRDVPPEFWVHNLEHGGIVVLYNCSADCQDLQTALKAFYMESPHSRQFQVTKLLISPNHKIDHTIVALAWDWELDLETADLPRLLDFYNSRLDHGPEAVP
jgi:hypothetical protein